MRITLATRQDWGSTCNSRCPSIFHLNLPPLETTNGYRPTYSIRERDTTGDIYCAVWQRIYSEKQTLDKARKKEPRVMYSRCPSMPSSYYATPRIDEGGQEWPLAKVLQINIWKKAWIYNLAYFHILFLHCHNFLWHFGAFLHLFLPVWNLGGPKLMYL